MFKQKSRENHKIFSDITLNSTWVGSYVGRLVFIFLVLTKLVYFKSLYLEREIALLLQRGKCCLASTGLHMKLNP